MKKLMKMKKTMRNHKFWFIERQQDQIKQLKKEMKDEYSVDDLKKMCRKNDLSQTGDDWMILDRVADAMINGPPSRCPNCHCRVYFNKKLLQYQCLGSYDEDKGAVVRCSFTSKTIERNKWKK
ncbi:MAG: hypothetical protein EZS28_018255 [Streblomastix strix]|uniref:PARP1-like PADR1 domain-containing protein n=1 Tax=Streblomastix strix TaxID=222440 RepID=A0A5J4VUC9_9EUKA|nr:MAG: hypothetical protein EZS28_018255 [Streblomastix strix]